MKKKVGGRFVIKKRKEKKNVTHTQKLKVSQRPS